MNVAVTEKTSLSLCAWCCRGEESGQGVLKIFDLAVVKCGQPYSVVGVLDSVQFDQELDDGVTPAIALGSAAFGAEGVQFVEEDDARRLPAGGLENTMSIVLGVSDPRVEHVADRQGDEIRAALRGNGLGYGGEQVSYSP
ncbi:hypothetical protein EES42_35080 [Streptomyces sp. ADI95-17]|nr:hypothetical protein EES42_35080 [Streptomyces sp. ADI95-17]